MPWRAEFGVWKADSHNALREPCLPGESPKYKSDQANAVDRCQGLERQSTTRTRVAWETCCTGAQNHARQDISVRQAFKGGVDGVINSGSSGRRGWYVDAERRNNSRT